MKALLEQALDQPPDERRAWIARSIPDPALRREVEDLLAAHDAAGDFLEKPPGDAALSPFEPGTRLGPYEILGEIGRGGGGVVYRAHDHRLRRDVALKLVAAGADPELRERLRREARAAATIADPTVATVYTIEEFDDQLFIVSEYVRGRTLRAALAEGPFPLDRVVATARGMARALRAAHAVGVVHRDLKPENVLLPDTGGVKIVDFGIARLNDPGSTQLTRHGALLGTPAYMAPEQFLGTVADARADIYAFGIVLSEMLSGRHPAGSTGDGQPAADDRGDATDGRRRAANNGQRATGGGQPAAGGQPPLYEALAAIAHQCTQLDPAARIQSADRLVAALAAVHLGHTPSRTRARWWWEFHQVAVAVVYAVSLWPAWYARASMGTRVGHALFILLVAAVAVGVSLRLHRWFTSRLYPEQLAWVRMRSAASVALSDTLFAAGLVSYALLIRAEDSSLEVLLLAIGTSTAAAALVIEPATTRAAFGLGGAAQTRELAHFVE